MINKQNFEVEANMDFKKIGSITSAIFIMLVLVIGLTGCNNFSEDELNTAVDNAVVKAQNENKAAQDEAIAKVQADAQKALDKAKAEAEAVKQVELAKLEAEKNRLAQELAAKAEQEVIEVQELAAYKIDDVSLTGTFAAVIDSDDYDKLKYYSVRFDGDDYDVEEAVVVTADVRPVYNFDDEGVEIFLEVADEGAIEYRVEFPEAIDFTDVNNDSDDELEVSFLGEDVVISKFDNGELTFYQGTSKFIQVGDSFTVGDLVVELVTVADDRALVKIGEDSAVVYEGRTKVISDVEVKVNDVLNNEDGPGYAEITVALDNDVEYVVEDGDEYEADDRFEYIVEPKTGNVLEAFGLRLAEKYTDDDEVFALSEGISFPNDYIKVTFESVLNADVEDITLRLSSDEIDLNYGGTIEFDGKRVEKNSIVFNVASGTPLTFEYETKTQEYENVSISELSKLVIFKDDRELNIKLTADTISIVDVDATKEYKFEYNTSNDEFIKALEAADIMDEDDDKLVDNGDVVYSSDVTDADKEDTVSIGLVGDEDVELVVKVE